MLEHRKEELAHAQDLRALLAELDIDHSGTLSLDELAAAAKDPHIERKLVMLEIEPFEALGFFETLTAALKVEELSIDQFANACMKMKGPASSMDVQAISFQVC